MIYKIFQILDDKVEIHNTEEKELALSIVKNIRTQVRQEMHQKIDWSILVDEPLQFKAVSPNQTVEVYVK